MIKPDPTRFLSILTTVGAGLKMKGVACGSRIGEGTFLSPWFWLSQYGDKNVPTPCGQALWPSAWVLPFNSTKKHRRSQSYFYLNINLKTKKHSVNRVLLSLKKKLEIMKNRLNRFIKPSKLAAVSTL